MPHQFVAGKGRAIAHRKRHPEPGRFAARSRFGQNKIRLKLSEATQEPFRVMPAFLDKPVQTRKLCHTDSGLHVGNLQIKAEM